MGNVVAEHWKPIDGYDGLYEVSNLGRVRSTYGRGKMLKPMLSNTGYERVDLFKDKKRKQFSVHRLVAKAFIENPEGKPFVNHKDESRTNNRADNLEWVTHKENCNYGTAIMRRVLHTDYSAIKRNTANQIKACSKPIAQFLKDGTFIRNWNSASECSRETGISISGIRMVVNGERNSIYGFVFREGEMTYR